MRYIRNLVSCSPNTPFLKNAWDIVLLLPLLVFIGSSDSTKFNTNNPRPNIVFILADDYGWNDVGYHGSEIRTPTLDRLARTGVRLENYYVQPICTPTRSQLLSGRYQIHTGLQHGIIRPEQRNGLPLEDPTIADKLKENGYSTHIIGKWHLGFYKKEYTPIYRGFDSYFGYLTGSEDYFKHNLCRRVEGHVYCGYDLRENDNVVHNYSGHYSAHIFTQKAEQIVSQHDSNKPLFLYLPFQSVHAPLQVPKKYLKQYEHIQDKNRRVYAAMTSCLDEAVRNVTDAFKKYGLWNNTILIFSTDNGGQVLFGGNNWPLRGWKGSLWEGGMRGVGFVNSPLLKNPNRISKDLIHVSDWFPTLLHLGQGSPTGLKLDGHNVWDTINLGKSSPRKEILHNIDPHYHRAGVPAFSHTFDTSVRSAIRVGDLKLITGHPGPGSWIPPPHNPSTLNFLTSENEKKNVWLFNITADPNEKNDISDSHVDLVRHLLDRLAYYNSTAVPVRYPAPDPQCNPALHGGAWGPWME